MAGASGAPIGDMMVITGTWLFGSYAAGKAFMLVQAFTVFLALIGTTLSCLSTGARVTYAMARDEEVSTKLGASHGKHMSPHKAIWTLAVISAIIGIITVTVYLGGTTPAALDKHNFWYSIGIFAPEVYAKLPNTLVIVTLISNFGTFLLYMITCWIAMVAFKEHHMLQRDQARGHPDPRAPGEPGDHALLPDRSLHGCRHELEGAVHRARGLRGVGDLWSHPLHEDQQGNREGSDPHQQAGGQGVLSGRNAAQQQQVGTGAHLASVPFFRTHFQFRK